MVCATNEVPYQTPSQLLLAASKREEAQRWTSTLARVLYRSFFSLTCRPPFFGSMALVLRPRGMHIHCTSTGHKPNQEVYSLVSCSGTRGPARPLSRNPKDKTGKLSLKEIEPLGRRGSRCPWPLIFDLGDAGIGEGKHDVSKLKSHAETPGVQSSAPTSKPGIVGSVAMPTPLLGGGSEKMSGILPTGYTADGRFKHVGKDVLVRSVAAPPVCRALKLVAIHRKSARNQCGPARPSSLVLWCIRASWLGGRQVMRSRPRDV